MSGRMENINGFSIFTPNDVEVDKGDFYISYNSHITDYGCDTTALVKSTKEEIKFLILNGNHTEKYSEIVNAGGGYLECLEYFKAHQSEKNDYSENWDEKLVFEDGIGMKRIKITEDF